MAIGNLPLRAMSSLKARSENGELAGRASELTYVQAKDLLVIRGDPRIPAELRFKPQDTNKGALGILSLNQGSFNTKTFGQEGELQISSMQWVPHGTPLPSNWKTGNVVPPPSGSSAANPIPGATSITPTTPRPRDGLQNLDETAIANAGLFCFRKIAALSKPDALARGKRECPYASRLAWRNGD